VVGTCIHHAAFRPPLFSAFSPMLAVTITMILATFRALLMATTGLPLLIASNDLRAGMPAVFLPSLTAETDDESRLAPSTSPLGPVHSPRFGERAENWSLAAGHGHHACRRFESKARSFRSGPSNFCRTSSEWHRALPRSGGPTSVKLSPPQPHLATEGSRTRFWPVRYQAQSEKRATSGARTTAGESLCNRAIRVQRRRDRFSARTPSGRSGPSPVCC
jgi:hypothetical protein